MIKSVTITVLIATFVAQGPAESATPPSRRAAEAQTNPTEQSQARDSQPAPGRSPNHPLYVQAVCERGCGYGQHDQGWWQKLATDPNATFAGFLALLTALLVGSGILQWLAMKRQEGQMQRASEQQSRDTRSLLVADQRPWVVIKGLKFTTALAASSHEGGFQSQISVHLHNTGKSPASRARIDARFLLGESVADAGVVGEHGKRARLELENAGLIRAAEPGFQLFPNEESPSDLRTEVEPETIARFLSAPLFRVFCSIIITYRDDVAREWRTSGRIYRVTFDDKDAFVMNGMALPPGDLVPVIEQQGNIAT